MTMILIVFLYKPGGKKETEKGEKSNQKSEK
mgnify:CR=1 FL=1